jgi:hypothetical protein
MQDSVKIFVVASHMIPSHVTTFRRPSSTHAL